MRKITWPLLLALGMGVCSPADAKQEHILPFPQHMTVQNKGNAVLTFAKGQRVTITGIAKNSALERFLNEFGAQATFNESGTGGDIKVIVGAQVMWEGKHVFNHDLAEYQNEAYHLVVSASGITIEAAAPIGVVRAAQTLTQMAEGWKGKKGVNLEAVDITDWPAFKLRGYMHDIGRSYMNVQELKEQIVNFSRFKVNTFHWHLTENQGFRFEVLNNPKNAEVKDIDLKKINSRETMTRHEGQFYTQQECREVAALAKEYGVTIIPEIDIPGHSAAFKRAFGFEMQDERALPILKEILRQVADVFPKVVSPYIDFGADEVATNAAFVKSIADEIHRLGRLAEVWNPINNVDLAQTGTDLHHMWGTRGRALVGKPNIDSRYNYTNHHDVFADLVGIYKSNIYFEPYGTKTVAGAICATWNDRRVANDDQIMKLNNIYATTIATACRAWQGGGEQYIDRGNNYGRPSDSHSNNMKAGGVVLPNSGKEYDDFKRWEDAFLFHKENSLLKVAHQIPYVKQTNVRWRITEAFPNGGDKNMKFPPEVEFENQTDHSKVLSASYNYGGKTYGSGMATGAGIYLSHTWGNDIIRGYYDNPQFGHTAYAWTYVYSPSAQTVGANIEFYNYSRSESNGIPSDGNWDHLGSKIWINGEAIAAPKYNRQDNTGSGKEKLLEDVNFAARTPIQVNLKQGWNQVFFKLPYINLNSRLPKWMFTCVFTDMGGLKAVDNLIYSPSQSMNVEAELTAVKIAEMETYRDSQVKDVPGYYNNPEAVKTLNVALDKVKATLKDDLTADQRKKQVAELEAALNVFKAALAKSAIVLPKTSTAASPVYYTIKADLRGNRLVTSKGKDAAVVGEVAELKTSCWRFTDRGDGTFDVINYDGNYLSPASAYNTAIKAVAARPDKGWKIETTGNVGRMIINCGKVELNQTGDAQHYQIYNWSNGESGQDKTDTGCQFSMSLVDDLSNMSLGGYVATVNDMQTGRVYTFQNQRSSKFLTVNAEGAQVAVQNSVQPSEQAGQWAYYVSDLGNKYLYSVKAKKFMDYKNGGIALVETPAGHGMEFKAAKVKDHADYPVMFTLNNGGGTVHVGGDGNLMYWTGGWSNDTDGGNAYRLNYIDNTGAELVEAIKTAVKKYENANPDLAVQPKLSNGSESFYYILKSNRENRMVTSKGVGQTLKGETIESRAAYWKFVNRTDGKGYNIINCADGSYLDQNMKASVAAPGNGWAVKYANATNRVIIVSGSAQLHQGNSGNYFNILNYGGGSNTTDEGCIYQLNEVAKEKWEVPAIPEVGKHYFFYSEHKSGDRYIYDNEGQTGFAAEKQDQMNYVWVCEKGADQKLRFKNLATNRYFGWQKLQTTTYDWEVDDTMGELDKHGVINKGCVTLKNGSFLVIKKNGANYVYDQASHAGYYSDQYSSDFKFVECKVDFSLPQAGQRYFLYNDHHVGHIYYSDNGGNVGFNLSKAEEKNYVWVCQKTAEGKYTFQNLATKRYLDWRKLSNNAFAWTVSATAEIINAGRGNVTLYGTDRYLVGKKDGFDQSTHKESGEVFSTDYHFEPCTIDFDAVKPADFMSNSYGQKWVRIYWNSNNSHVMGFMPTDKTGYDQRAAKSNIVELTNEEQLWTLVGSNEAGFKLQNKAAGNALAVKISGTGEASTTSMVAVKDASLWKLMVKADGVFAITPANATGMSLNSYGGALKELKLYAAGDPGSQWQLETVVPAFQVASHVKGSVEAQYLLGGGTLNFIFNGRNVSSTVENNPDFKPCYLPVGAKVKVEQGVSRGYKADQLLVNGVKKPFAELTVAENMQDKVEAFFTSSYEAGLYLYKTPAPIGGPYRIPAITTAPNGHIFAISDHRPGGMDVGYGEVDIKCRISTDNGEHWGEEFFLANGHGKVNATNNGPWDYAFGDAAVVADCERNEVLIMMVCGKTVCHDGQYDPNDPYNPAKSPNRVARVRAKFNEAKNKWSFTAPEEVTFDIYPLFDKVKADGTKERTVRSLFIGSGRICQSRVTKVKDYYRLYCAAWTKNEGNRVIYSDDFGESWHILGTVDDRPARGGDEPKCEELPNGDVILSSRNGGRIFNIFRFSDRIKGTGKWGVDKSSKSCPNGINVGNNTNGEIMLFKAVRKTDNKKVVVAVQSVPWGSQRTDVGVYYKEIPASLYDHNADLNQTVVDLASNWTKGMHISHTGSAYSTMTLQKDNKIGFFFEENPNDYCQVYLPLTLEQLTLDHYTLRHDDEATAAARAVLNKKGVGYPMAGVEARTDLQHAIMTYEIAQTGATAADAVALQDAVNAYKLVKTNIQLPEEGKAYRLISANRNGKDYYLTNEYVGNGTAHVVLSETQPEGTDGIFVCRKVGDKYAFVNNNGKYLVWSTDGGSSYSGKASCPFADTYNAGHNWTIKVGHEYNGNGREATTKFGTLSLLADNGNLQMVQPNGTFHNGQNPGDQYETAGGNCVYWRFEEVSYPNSPKLNPIVGEMVNIGEEKTIGTFSAPFATVLPEGVSAFYIAADDVNVDHAKLTKVVENQAIPAHQGVILTSQNIVASNVVMLPATSEVQANLGGNKLGHSAGAAKQLEGDFYLLGKFEGNVGFFLGNAGVLGMNKAYLPMTAAQAQGLKLVWNEETTGIEGVEAEDETAPIYDLSGRRVLQTVKGGIYIQNGKKFIVK